MSKRLNERRNDIAVVVASTLIPRIPENHTFLYVGCVHTRKKKKKLSCDSENLSAVAKSRFVTDARAESKIYGEKSNKRVLFIFIRIVNSSLGV